MSDLDFRTAPAALGLTRRELAEALGVAYPTLGKWARGERSPDAAALNALRMLVFLQERGHLTAWLATVRARPQAVFHM